MTIRYLMEQGICLQGWIKIRKLDADFNNSDIIIDYSSNTNGENIPEEALDLEIKYMYAEDNDLIIEVVETEN